MRNLDGQTMKPTTEWQLIGDKPEVVELPTWGSFRDFWVNCVADDLGKGLIMDEAEFEAISAEF